MKLQFLLVVRLSTACNLYTGGKWMLRQRIFVTYAMIGALFGSIASCQKDRGSETLFGAVHAGEELISVVPWNVGDETLLCVVVERVVKVRKRDTWPVRVMTVYRKRDATIE